MKLTLQALSMSLYETAEYLQDLAKDVANLPELGQGINNIRLTGNFNLKEFQCPCCGAVKIDPELVKRLQAIRDKVGKPIIVTSGYRCPSRNRQVGGATNSQHLHGRAADVLVRGLTAKQLYNVLEPLFPDGGVGRYVGYIHVDTRGQKARWSG